MSTLGRLEHVFSNIPNDRRHRAAIEALRPFAYIAHAANAYPKLVEALRLALDRMPALADATPADMHAIKEGRCILRDLGEAP